MNRYKIQGIVDYIRRQGKLPEDQFGELLSVDDILGWYGLDELLDSDERRALEREIHLLAEAQRFLDRMTLDNG